MARVLLVLPPLPQRLNAPYLGQQYVAAALVEAGHAVRCLSLANVTEEEAPGVVETAANDFTPDLIGFTLFTYNARVGYDMAGRLRGAGSLLVAGGPHPTALPREPLSHGFDISVAGEGERAIVRILSALSGGRAITDIPGVYAEEGQGPAYETIDDLDQVPFPHRSAPCYGSMADAAPAGGLMTSRGCPARCTFCANYVTGRAYRWRSAKNVIAEMVALKDGFGLAHFPFWDDAFTARRPRLMELCDAIEAEPRLAGITWTCITPGNMVMPRDLERMRRAGCVAINFGIESGDRTVLLAIQKGQTPERIAQSVEAAKRVGMITIVNFMFGFPGEGLPELANTKALMETLAPNTDVFNNFGVLVPFPGTNIYDRRHAEFGFTDWWLDRARIPDAPGPGDEGLSRDPALEKDFFSYAPAVRNRIAELVSWKADHNRARHASQPWLKRSAA